MNITYEHPLLRNHLALLRSAQTQPAEFRWRLKEASRLLLGHVLSEAPCRNISVETPLAQAPAEELEGPITLVGILRAGLGMIEGMLEMLPKAPVGHIGLFRDEESLKPVHYYTRIPPTAKSGWTILVDPMLATGGSAVEAVNILKRNGAKTIKMICLIAAQKGIDVLQKAHPDVDLTLAAVDPILNNKGYIVPGLGDCGDRLFGTI